MVSLDVYSYIIMPLKFLISYINTVAYLGFHFGGGGFKIFLEKWGYLHGAKRHAARGEATRLLGGFGGRFPRENF